MNLLYKVPLKITAGWKRGIFFCAVMWCLFLQSDVAFAEEERKEPGQLYALSAALLDGENGRLLYGKEADTKRANASTTKIMTCILALENANPDDMVAVSEYAASMPNVQMHIEEGEYYRMEDLLYSLMLESHNDSAVAIAEHVGGSTEKFAAQMNQKAKEIGCKNTFFITPNGLDAKEKDNAHETTAEDLAKMMAYCVWESPKRDAFVKITETKQREVFVYQKKENEYIKGGVKSVCTNHNAYLEQNTNCISGKTGFTGDAGYCYVCAVESEGRKYTIALLGCGWPNNKSYKWKDCATLTSFLDKNYHIRELPVPSEKAESVIVENAANPEYALGKVCRERPYYEEIKGSVLMADWESLTVKTSVKKKIAAGKKEEKKVGNLEIFLGNEVLLKRDIMIAGKYSPRNLYWYFQAVFHIWSNQNGDNTKAGNL